MLGDTVVTSVLVLVDESILIGSADYFGELNKATVNFDPEERHVSDYDWRVSQYHIDEGILSRIRQLL